MCHDLHQENTSRKSRDTKVTVFNVKLFSTILQVISVCVTAIPIIHSERSRFSVSDEWQSIYGSGHRIPHDEPGPIHGREGMDEYCLMDI